MAIFYNYVLQEEQEIDLKSCDRYFANYILPDGEAVIGFACHSYYTYVGKEKLSKWREQNYTPKILLFDEEKTNRQWLEWVLNGEQFGEAFVTKDVDEGFRTGFEINMSCLNWRVACAIQAIRAPWEFDVGKVVETYKDHLTMPEIALLHCLNDRASRQLAYVNTNHLYLNYTDARNFLNNTPNDRGEVYGEFGVYIGASSQVWGDIDTTTDLCVKVANLTTVEQVVKLIKGLSE